MCQPQVAIDIEDNTIAPGPGKGKAEKGKKTAKKPPGKVDVVEVRGMYGVLC